MLVSCPECRARVRVPNARVGETSRCARCKRELTPLDRPVALEGVDDFDALIREARLPVLVDFWAPWCGPCRMVAPELEKLARERKAELVIAKVDTDALPELGRRFGIASIPTLVVFEQGRERRRISGAMPADRMARELGI